MNICEKKAVKKNQILVAPSEEKKVVVGNRICVDFKKHIYQVCKDVNPELKISVKSMEMMNDIMNYLLHKFAEEATKNSASGRLTLDLKDVIPVVRTFPKELSDHAHVHGYRVTTTYQADSNAFNERESQQLADCLHQVKIID